MRALAGVERMRGALSALAFAATCCTRPPPPPAPPATLDAGTATPQQAEPRRTRCERAGGVCVGPAAIAASPHAPCPAGMHRVDDVAVPGNEPACFGIPFGEEACCTKE